MGIWVKNKGAPTTSDPGHDLGWNTLTANKEGIRFGIGDVPNGYAWADIHHNTISANTVAGINVSAAVYGLSLYSSHATIRDQNVISGSPYGIRIQAWLNRTGVPQLPPYALIYGKNSITGNTYGVYLQGASFGGLLEAPWANLTGNNTISGNQYGIWIDGPTVDPTSGHFWLFWNNVNVNSIHGLHVENPQGQWGGNVYPWAKCNWWNSAGGPHDPLPGNPDTNPNPLGQPVSDYFRYRDPIGASPRYEWLNNTSVAPGTVCVQG